MVHPRPADATREAFFAWLIGKPYTPGALPNAIRTFEQYKVATSVGIPPVPFQMLTALNLTRKEWAHIALQSGWHMVRMNLNTFTRHGVFDLNGMDQQIAAKLKDAKAIRAARVFPYQLLVAYKMAGKDVPRVVCEALQDALELAIENVPAIPGQLVVCPDVSGSMASPITGHRHGSTTSVRCVDVAGLIAAAFLRKNEKTLVVPFETGVCNVSLNPRDTVMTNAQKLAAIGGGGTNCSAPLALLNKQKVQADMVIFVSDNQSWVDARNQGATEMMRQWEVFKQRNHQAKLVCLDIQPYGTTQAAEREGVLNVGGFSDEVFTIIDRFAHGELTPEHWVSVIDAVEM
jgi:60 kDa SS-A/Ro ribonucleoprotein